MPATGIRKSNYVGQSVVYLIVDYFPVFLGNLYKERLFEFNKNALWLTISAEFKDVLGFDFRCELSRFKRHNKFANCSRRLAFFRRERKLLCIGGGDLDAWLSSNAEAATRSPPKRVF